MSERITITVCTKDRPQYLLIMLSSLLNQTYQDWDLTLFDCSREPVINLEPVERLLQVFTKYGHKTKYETGLGIGIPQSYQKMLDMSETELLVRQEDDIFMEAECLQRAYEVLTKDGGEAIGAVGFMTPNFLYSRFVKAPEQLKNGFKKIDSSSLCPGLPLVLEAVDEQELVVHEDVVWKVCVIHAGSLYRRTAAEQVGGFCTHLSPVGHREETLFYIRMYMTGWDLAVRSTARLWHFEASLGGSRPDGATSNSRQAMRRSDESKFQAELKELMTAHPDRPLQLFGVD